MNRPGAALLLVGLFLAVATGRGQEPRPESVWPQFRGPQGAGLVPTADLPERWSTTENVAWVTPVPGRGWSSPVVWGDRVFVTSAENLGRFKPPSKGIFGNDYIAELVARGLTQEEATQRALERDIEKTNAESPMVRWWVFCLDLASGKIRWQRRVHQARPAGGRHRKNTYASETPVTDGERVYVYFGNVGLFAYSMEGEVLWSRPLPARKIYLDFGTGSSPAAHGDHVYVVNDNEESSFIAAFHKTTGEEAWRTPRSRGANNTGWATPFVWRYELRTEIVTVGVGKVTSYDTRGKELWWLYGVSGVPAPTPVAGSGLLYISSGAPEEAVRPVFAVRPGAVGDISVAAGEAGNDSVAWYDNKAGTYIPSPLVYDRRLYLLYDKGFFAAYDAVTGKKLYRARIGRGGNTFTSSPWAYNGKVFCLSEDGVTFVLAAGDEYQKLGENRLDEMTLATPAIAGNSLLIRTATRLYGIRKPPPR